jgi:glycosyltransferase involved in cell wall biosynthesis
MVSITQGIMLTGGTFKPAACKINDLALIQAQACRIPVIAADDGAGCSELVQNGVNGWLFDQRSAKHLAETMLSAIESPSRARRLGHRGYM